MIRTEIWNGYKIRFVEIEGEWWAVLKDIAEALKLKAKRVKERLTDEVVSTDLILDSMGRSQEMLVERQLILGDVVELMGAKEKFELDISISEIIYEKYGKEINILLPSN